MGAHTNSDDPTRYVPEDELSVWRARDPVERFVTELRQAGAWDDARHDAAVAAVEERLERIIERALAREVDPGGRARPRGRARRVRDPLAQRAAIVERSGVRVQHDATDRDSGGLSWRRHDDARGFIRETLLDDGWSAHERVVLLGEDIGVERWGVPRHRRCAWSASVPSACSTPRSRSRPSSARRSGCRSPGWCRWPRSSSAASPCRRTTSSSGSSPGSATAARGRYQCPVTVRSAPGGGVRTPEHHSDLGSRHRTPHTLARLERRGAVERGRRQGTAHHRGAQRRSRHRLRTDPVLPLVVRGARRRAPLVPLGVARGGAAGARRRGDHHVGRDGRRRGRRRPTSCRNVAARASG